MKQDDMVAGLPAPGSSRAGAIDDEGPTLRIDLRALVRTAWRRRLGLLRLHLAVAALAIAVVFLLPRSYVSNVTLVPAPRDGLSLDLTGMASSLGGGSLSLMGGPTPQDQLEIVLKSRAVADTLVRRHGLSRLWKLGRLEQARRRLAEHTVITTPKEGHVMVAVEAETPLLARDLAASYALAAGAEAVRIKSSLAGQRRLYLESRLRDLDLELGVASKRLRDFEEKNGAVSLLDQARETMGAAAQLRTQVALLETELAAARRYFADASPEVTTLRARIDALERQLDRLAHSGGTMLPKGDALPALKQTYLDLHREQASLLAVSELLRRVYEQARVEEANPVLTFSVLDAAELPERHAWPKRGLTVGLALSLTFVASILVPDGQGSARREDGARDVPGSPGGDERAEGRAA